MTAKSRARVEALSTFGVGIAILFVGVGLALKSTETISRVWPYPIALGIALTAIGLISLVSGISPKRIREARLNCLAQVLIFVFGVAFLFSLILIGVRAGLFN